MLRPEEANVAEGEAILDIRVPAPELPDELEWVNTREPVRLGALRGRVVVLHFWCHSSVNAQHNLPDLRHLENKYHDGLSVVSIHSGQVCHSFGWPAKNSHSGSSVATSRPPPSRGR